jgi:hypothetical protein
MDRWIGMLFYYRVQPGEIKSMTWSEMKYWNNWATLIEKEKAAAANK